MSDIRGAPRPSVILAKLDLQIDEQMLALEQKDLRLLELDEEQANIERDISRVEALQSESEGAAAKVKDKATAEARRHSIKAHELALQVKGKRIRLLELDDERDSIRGDKAAAELHITKLKAEVSQQQERLKESSSG